MLAANDTTPRKHKNEGARYEAGLRGPEIAKRVRADIKAAVAKRALPAARYSVRSGFATHAMTIDVTISDVEVLVLNVERLAHDHAHPHASCSIPWMSDEASALIDAVRAIVNAYNFDNSDSQTDYFNVNFYEQIDFAHDMVRAQREALEASFAAVDAAFSKGGA